MPAPPPALTSPGRRPGPRLRACVATIGALAAAAVLAGTLAPGPPPVTSPGPVTGPAHQATTSRSSAAAPVLVWAPGAAPAGASAQLDQAVVRGAITVRLEGLPIAATAARYQLRAPDGATSTATSSTAPFTLTLPLDRASPGRWRLAVTLSSTPGSNNAPDAPTTTESTTADFTVASSTS